MCPFLCVNPKLDAKENSSNLGSLLGIDSSPLVIEHLILGCYLYAVPSGGNFSIVASTGSPIAATPGQMAIRIISIWCFFN